MNYSYFRKRATFVESDKTNQSEGNKEMKKSLAVLATLVMMISLLLACGGGNNENNGGAANNGGNTGGNTAGDNAGSENAEGGETPANIAVVFATGGLGDKSFNDNGYAGIERAKSELGITYDYVEPQEISEFETHHREFARAEEYDLIVGIGFDQVDAIGKVASEFPDQKFLIIDSVVENAPNVASAIFKSNEAAFLAGAVSANQSETKKIGFLGGMDIPLINEFLAGYQAGAKYIDDSVEVLVNYVGNWGDPNTGKEMTISMYDNGADIVYAAAGGSGLGVFTAAGEKGKMSIGADMTPSQMPDVMYLGTLKRIDNVIFDNVKSVIDGNWEGGLYNLGLAEDAVGYSVEGSNIETPQEYIDKAEELKTKIVSGELEIPNTLDAVDAWLAENK